MHRKLNKLKKIKDRQISFLLPNASDSGPKIKGPNEKPIKKIAIDNWTELEDASNSFEMSTVAGIYASIENGAKIVMQATETKK